jgi:hypothetical protein
VAALAGLEAWERRSAGPGAHGQRFYDSTVLTLDPAGVTDALFRRDGVIGCWFADSSIRPRARRLSWRSTVARAR